MWPKEIVFVRHGESEGNVRTKDERAEFDVSTHRYGLTEKGRKQARITGEWLKEEYGEFDFYYTSYYERAVETMRLMYPEQKVYEDPRLAEAQRGHYHTLTDDEFAKKYPDELARKQREGLYHYRPFGGENWADVELRIHSFLSTLARDHPGETGLIVCHGHWLLLFQRLIHHFSINEAVARYNGKASQGIFANTSVTIYKEMLHKRKKLGKPIEVSRLIMDKENFVPWEGKI